MTETMEELLTDIECPICGKFFDSIMLTEQHLNATHLDGENDQQGAKLVCPLCQLDFAEEAELLLHSELHFSEDEAGNSRADNNSLTTSADDELAIMQAQYGMLDDGNSYARQAEKELTDDLYRQQLDLTDYYKQKRKVAIAKIAGVEDPKWATGGLLANIRLLSLASPDVSEVHVATAVDHYSAARGDSGWGCGYRNCQMLMSALREDPDCRRNLFGVAASHMPSVPKIQQLIEAAWREGFDAVGAEQLNFKLVDTRKWIGATEVAALLHSFRIDAQVVDFHKYSGEGRTHPVLLSRLWDHFSRPEEPFVAPVYLQHAGHSRTVVGVERLKSGALRLLIFDPSHRRDRLELLRAGRDPKLLMSLRKGLRDLPLSQYQAVIVRGVMRSAEDYEKWKKSIPLVRVP